MTSLILLCLLCGMYDVLAKESTGKDQKGKYSIPHLDVTSRQLVLNANHTLLLNCRGRWQLSWTFPAGLPRSQVEMEGFRCGRTSHHYCSRVRVGHIQAKHTGLFRCRYQHRPHKQASVYVYVTDRWQPFVEDPSMTPDVVYMKKNQPLVIPCRATRPNINTTLVKYLGSLGPDPNIVWSSRRGFTIKNPNFDHIGLFTCETRIDEVTFKSRGYFVHRPVSNITSISLNTRGPVQALKGQRLVLNCTVKAELNTRISFNWDYPGKNDSASFTSKRLHKFPTHLLFYSTLTILKLQLSNQGLYTCHVTSGDQRNQTNVTVTVYDRPFIRLKPRNGSVLVVQAGQKSYRISPKLQAFPVPKVIWLKDGRLAADQCSRYNMDGNSLVIRDVAEEDAGKYTVLVRIPEHRLFRNLTFTLQVNVSPQIGEKAVLLQDPGSVPRGSRKALRCTSHGVPSPHIQWLWHVCPPKAHPAAPPQA